MNGHVNILIGDCREHMQKLPERSIHCVMTSPPYWGLRDYDGVEPVKWADGSACVFGNEPTIQQYVAHTLEVFDGLRRVLRDDGVIWWNIGDSYATAAGKAFNPGSRAKPRGGSEGKHQYINGYPATQANRLPQTITPGNKLMIPHRVAIALQDAGWCVRQDVVWAKKRPMPESMNGVRWKRCRVKIGRKTVEDGGLSSWDMGEHTHGPSGNYRGEEKTVPEYAPCPGCDKCRDNDGYVLRRAGWRHTNGHEYVFMITKSNRYFCDHQAAQEPAVKGNCGSKFHQGKTAHSQQRCSTWEREDKQTRNPRSVLSLSGESYNGAHFATYPSELVLRLLRPACSQGGCCAECGAQYAPIVESSRQPTRPGNDSKLWRVSDKEDSPYNGMVVGNRDPQRHITVTETIGYRPTCDCQADKPPVPPTVFDPFGGSGTTAQVASHMGFNAITCEMSAAYLELLKERIAKVPRCLMSKNPKRKRRRKKRADQLELFEVTSARAE